MALLTLQEAKDTLRIDGTDNDTIIQPLIDALPDYMQATTGSAWDDDKAAGYNLAKACAKFLICKWFDMNTDYEDEISRLLATLSVIARSGSNG